MTKGKLRIFFPLTKTDYNIDIIKMNMISFCLSRDLYGDYLLVSPYIDCDIELLELSTSKKITFSLEEYDNFHITNIARINKIKKPNIKRVPILKELTAILNNKLKIQSMTLGGSFKGSFIVKGKELAIINFLLNTHRFGVTKTQNYFNIGYPKAAKIVDAVKPFLENYNLIDTDGTMKTENVEWDMGNNKIEIIYLESKNEEYILTKE